MTKLITNDLVNLVNETATVNSINNNFAAVETAMENTLSRDGTSPNAMGADLDMNNRRILNLPTPTAPNDVVRFQDLTLTYLSNTTLSPTPVLADAHKVLKINTAGDAYTFSGILIDASNNLTIPASGNFVITQGNATVTNGNIVVTLGGVTLTSGNLLLSSGDVTLTNGNIVQTLGNHTLTSGSLVLTAGNATLTAGHLSLDNGYIDITEQSAPSSPSANVGRIYVKDNSTVTDLYFKDNAGLETRLSVHPATQSIQETGTATDSYVTPGVQKHNPLHPKAWAKVTGGASPVLTASSGFASVSRPALGRILLTMSTAMSSANYCIMATVERASTLLTVANTLHCTVRNATPTTTTFELECYDNTATTNLAVDPTAWYVTILGDQ